MEFAIGVFCSSDHWGSRFLFGEGSWLKGMGKQQCQYATVGTKTEALSQRPHVDGGLNSSLAIRQPQMDVEKAPLRVEHVWQAPHLLASCN